MDKQIEMLSTEYHLQTLKYKGKRYIIDSFDRQEFEVCEKTDESEYVGTFTALNDEELVRNIKALFKGIGT